MTLPPWDLMFTFLEHMGGCLVIGGALLYFQITLHNNFDRRLRKIEQILNGD